jgi:hypothetical protein
MRETRLLQLCVLAAVLSAAGAGAAGFARSSPSADADRDKKTLAEIAGYRKWTRVTARPVPIDISSVGG